MSRLADHVKMTSPGRFVSLELFIIDTFTRVDADGKEHPIDRADEMGGAGTYAMIGARMFLPPSKLGMIIDYSSATFPTSMRKSLDEYGTEMMIFRERKDGHGTTRAVNRYKGQDRGFEYLNKPLLLSPSSLLHTPLVDPLPTSLHLVTFPERGLQILAEIDQVALAVGVDKWSPRLIWEPEPPCCVPAYVEVIREITSRVDVMSPNHTEALSLLNVPLPESTNISETRRLVTQACVSIANWRPRLATIIRAGALGCCYIPSSLSSVTLDDVRWVPAYWDSMEDGDTSGSREKVVDPTGAGNAFMGGLGAALESGQSLRHAILWASVAASFTVEQHGPPLLTLKGNRELWNGHVPMDRVEEMKARVKSV